MIGHFFSPPGGGAGGEAEAAVCYALQTGYRLIDTAVFHGLDYYYLSRDIVWYCESYRGEHEL